jgi:hypothetical protein
MGEDETSNAFMTSQILEPYCHMLQPGTLKSAIYPQASELSVLAFFIYLSAVIYMYDTCKQKKKCVAGFK